VRFLTIFLEKRHALCTPFSLPLSSCAGKRHSGKGSFLSKLIQQAEGVDGGQEQGEGVHCQQPLQDLQRVRPAGVPPVRRNGQAVLGVAVVAHCMGPVRESALEDRIRLHTGKRVVSGSPEICGLPQDISRRQYSGTSDLSCGFE